MKLSALSDSELLAHRRKLYALAQGFAKAADRWNILAAGGSAGASQRLENARRAFSECLRDARRAENVLRSRGVRFAKIAEPVFREALVRALALSTGIAKAEHKE